MLIDNKIIAELKALGLKADDNVFIHSAFRGANIDANVFINTLKSYFKNRIMMPSHTWGVVKNNGDVFDVRNTKSNLGILNELFKGEEDLDDVDKIMKVHDYIINNTRYDIERNETGTSQYRSNNAYGTLFEGYAICGGYADTMAIFLTKMGFKNFKIASTTHVWNAVFIDGKWLHLDLTWDDPVDDTGNDYLYHKYFLVSTETLKDEDGNYAEHNFDQSIYLEFKN